MNEELQKLKEEFEQRIKELEDKYEPKKEWLKYGDKFWYILSSGKVRESFWQDATADDELLEFGNIFKSEAEAEFMVEKLKVIKELKQLARPFKVNSANYVIELDHIYMDFKILVYYDWQPTCDDFYFNTEEEAEQAINIIGADRIKKYLFGVKEGDSK